MVLLHQGAGSTWARCPVSEDKDSALNPKPNQNLPNDFLGHPKKLEATIRTSTAGIPHALLLRDWDCWASCCRRRLQRQDP